MLSHFEFHHKLCSYTPLNISQYNSGQTFLLIIQARSDSASPKLTLNNKIPATNTSDTLCFATRIGFGFAISLQLIQLKYLYLRSIADHKDVATQQYYHLNLQSIRLCQRRERNKVTEKAIVYDVCI